MTSKKLGALLRSVPPATATLAEEAALPIGRTANGSPDSAALAAVPRGGTLLGPTAVESLTEPEVPLQVLIPANVRRQLAIKAAEQGESLRALVLKAIRGLGVEVTDADIKGKRGRRNS